MPHTAPGKAGGSVSLRLGWPGSCDPTSSGPPSAGIAGVHYHTWPSPRLDSRRRRSSPTFCLYLCLFPQVITYSSRHVYNNLTEEQKGRVAFASNFLAGDASLQIEPLKPSDEGRYTCKVKNSGRYVWSHVILKVLGKVGPPG